QIIPTSLSSDARSYEPASYEPTQTSDPPTLGPPGPAEFVSGSLATQPPLQDAVTGQSALKPTTSELTAASRTSVVNMDQSVLDAPNSVASLQQAGTTTASAVKSTTKKPVTLEDIFVLEINNIIDSFFLVAEFVPNHV
ncbi:unnamed protein product, partial [Lymnaea stagnalis]